MYVGMYAFWPLTRLSVLLMSMAALLPSCYISVCNCDVCTYCTWAEHAVYEMLTYVFCNCDANSRNMLAIGAILCLVGTG